MNKNGFTLVELMGILVILGVLLVFTVPSITKTLKNSEVKEMEEYEETVCAAAKSYVEVKRLDYPQEIKFKKLRDEGYLSGNVKNPENGNFEKDRHVRVRSQDGKVYCTFSAH